MRKAYIFEREAGTYTNSHTHVQRACIKQITEKVTQTVTGKQNIMVPCGLTALGRLRICR